ncbi:Uncharacterised protein [Escherichia coli]|uniref:hypothetical protein n=1 Tax=Escherichia coli TaxID=562 RepID=UPI0010B69F3D|nr:hypothetical protein [Escherichia coli]VVZ30940.1 Uncharacterised protein [Escherichia coli]VVZ34701.1 Uncharacterised protein [Escherichia coli]VWN20966.1 Uncharacterised protein [Escherichia coli]GCJ80449.1 hypothetical protein BvCmsB5655_03451 [Escherichia coli]HBB9485550.1 hypothetical protein [Escherichia coli]
MTTVYIDKRLNLLITDSRVTSTIPRNLFGFFPLRPKYQYGVVNQKTLYVHDRLFSASGAVSEIDKVLDWLINKVPVIPDRKLSCHCVLLSKDYVIHMILTKGKFIKKLEYLHEDYTFFMGSGGEYMVDAAIHEEHTTLYDKVFSTFMDVHNHDCFTDDNINVYRF